MDILQRVDLTLGPLLASFFLGFATIVLLYWYSSRNHDYWKNLGVPFAKPYPIFGSLLEGFRQPLHELEVVRNNKFGRIYGHYEGDRAVLSVSEPQILRNILLKDFQAFTGRRRFETGDNITENMISVLQGEAWKRVRTIVTPTFTTGKLKRMMKIFKDSSGTLVKNFKEASLKGEPIEVRSIYGAFSMDVIASSAFSTKIDSHNVPNNEFVKRAKQLFTNNITWRFVLFFVYPRLMKFFSISIFSPKAIKFFTDVTLQIIEERKRTGQTRNDFLQLLLDTAEELSQEGKLDVNEEDNIAENYGSDENDQIFKFVYSKKSLSRDELVAQCVIFFLAGYHTTAVALSFVTYFLALNPDIQERVIQDLDEALKANNGELTYEALQSMKYLDNVISETMRLYPPATRMERMADEDYEIAEAGLIVPKGMIITIPVYAMHRDPQLYPDPEKFDPDRFTPEEREKRDQYAYLPFGAGPRNCVGMRFALLEMKVCLAYVLSNFRIKKCSKTKVPLDFYNGQGLLQPKDIMLFMEIRKDIVKAL